MAVGGGETVVRPGKDDVDETLAGAFDSVCRRAALVGGNVRVESAPEEELPPVQHGRAIEQSGRDAAAVVRDRRRERKRAVGEERRAAAHAEAYSCDLGGLHAAVRLEPVEGRGAVSYESFVRQRVDVRHHGLDVVVVTIEIRCGAMKELWRYRNKAARRVLIRDGTVGLVHAECGLEHLEPLRRALT